MKNIIKIPLILILICCLSCGFITAGAEDGSQSIITLNPYFDIDSSELVVSGTVESAKGSVPMVLTIKREGKLISAEQIVTGPSDGTTVSFEFTGIPFKNTTPSGDYAIYVSAGFVGAEANDVYTYDGADRRFAAVKAVNEAIDEESVTKLIKAIGDYKGLITGGDNALFDLDEGQAVFAKLFFGKGSYELPADYESDANVATITESVQKLAANYKELLVIAEAADLDDADALNAWLTKYAEDKGFYAEDDDTEFSEVTLGKYFDEAKAETILYTKIVSAAKLAEDFAALKADMLDAGVLTLLETGKDYKLREITEAIPALFTVNASGFEALSDANKTKVYQDLTAVPGFDSVADYISEFNKAVTDNTPSGDDDDDSGSSGSRGSSSRGGGTTIVQAKTETQTDAAQPQISGFTDIADCAWAHEAIGYLSSKGVVAGRGQGIFDPYAPTTRAEFIKMVAVAFGYGEGSYNGSFADVSAADWYAPYVASAQDAGIATGTDDGRFLPGELITRQDMAVILYRAKGMTPSANEKDVFYDSYSISDYAKSAVFAMYEKGIALGTGDGSFAPLRNATRAEAAQMIYKVIMN